MLFHAEYRKKDFYITSKQYNFGPNNSLGRLLIVTQWSHKSRRGSNELELLTVVSRIGKQLADTLFFIPSSILSDMRGVHFMATR